MRRSKSLDKTRPRSLYKFGSLASLMATLLSYKATWYLWTSLALRMYAPNLCTAQIAVHMLEIFCFFFWGTVANYLNVGDVVDDGSDEDCNCIIGNDDDDDVDHDDHDDDDVDDDDDDVDEDDDDD